LFPAIAVARELKKIDKNCQVILVTGKKSVAVRILKNEDFLFFLLPPLPRPTLANFISFLIRLSQAAIRSLIALRRVRPNAVVGFGGLLSAPVLLWARLLRIPTIIHEQNVMPGRANTFLSKIVDAIAVSFDETLKVFKEKEKIIFTGNPIRSSLNVIKKEEALKEFSFNPEGFNLFVMGGSQGAHSINRAVVGAFEKFKPDQRRIFQIIHITGETDCRIVQDRYEGLDLNSRVYSFMEKIDSAYSVADLIISRAGASAISEINSLGKAAILVPYPHARSHQVSNARYMAKRNMAVLLNDDEDLPQTLYDKILNFYNNRSALKAFTQTQKLEGNAARNMVNLIVNLKSEDEKT